VFRISPKTASYAIRHINGILDWQTGYWTKKKQFTNVQKNETLTVGEVTFVTGIYLKKYT
jgi:hypothetical protein